MIDQVLSDVVLSSSALLAKPRPGHVPTVHVNKAPRTKIMSPVRVNFFNIGLNVIDINRLAGVW